MSAQQLLPPGLVDGNLEFFSHNGELKVLYNGIVQGFNELPLFAYGAIKKSMLAQPDVMERFVEEGVWQEVDQVYVFARCMFGGYNHEPDITAGGRLSAPDNFNCGCNGFCVLKDIVKHSMPVAHGYLTPREIEIVKLLAGGLMGKQIAAALGISEFTVDKHKHNIFCKTGLSCNVELAVWATNNHLI
jgi:DNA-binding CsgD family transcriptional regulator